jgi:hypothetical protein
VYRAWQGGVWRGKHEQLKSVEVFVAAGCLLLTCRRKEIVAVVTGGLNNQM